MTRYDVLVIGAGSAGCVMAARLSQDPKRRVAVIEAGPDGSSEAIDGLDFYAARDEPGRTWPDVTARRSSAQPVVPYPRGRGLGGTSAVNAMVATSGFADDYDRWEALGADGWRWSDVGPVFSKLHGKAGALRLASAPEGSATRAVADAWARQTNGKMTPAMLTISGRRRWSNADAYLEPARSRANLDVLCNTTVERVVFEQWRAVGVELADGRSIEAADIVVSAGAIHTPRLLMRSGVGRPGVGRNLRDHPAVEMTIVRRSAATDHPIPAIRAFSTFSSGDMPGDLQLLPLEYLPRPDSCGPDSSLAMVMVALMHPHSQGVVSADHIDFRMLSDERDRARLRIGARAVLAMVTDSGFGEFAEAVYVDSHATPAKSLVGATDDELDTWMLGSLGGYSHAAGTCRMGSTDDPDAVCDPAGRVIGYEGLRVCDASLMPDLPRANPHLPVTMMAERIAAMMRAR